MRRYQHRRLPRNQVAPRIEFDFTGSVQDLERPVYVPAPVVIGRGGGQVAGPERPLPEEIEAMRRANDDYARGECVRLEDLQRELGLRAR